MENSYLDYLMDIRKNGEKRSIYSACSSNLYVIRAVLLDSKRRNIPALIEATANQVNQYGGYTGMRPDDFRDMVWREADRIGLPRSMIILGGDHLGPVVWANENEEEAMTRAEELVKAYAKAGFRKIHIDTSMRLASDSTEERLPDEIIAKRAARLAKVIFDNADEFPNIVIGSEVPIPGGAQENTVGLEITKPENFLATVGHFRSAFYTLGLGAAWDKVTACVVQPGVEYGDTEITRYDRSLASDLVAALDGCLGIYFEAHSTDYQSASALRELAEDGFIVLKVGPELTFKCREAFFALESIEKELVQDKARLSNYSEVLEKAMLDNPGHWAKYYSGSEQELKIKRKYSYSDRSRYYQANRNVVNAAERLIENLAGTEIPIPVLSQYMPLQANAVEKGEITLDPEALIKSKITEAISKYQSACFGQPAKE